MLALKLLPLTHVRAFAHATISAMANKKDWKTKLIHSDATVPEGFRSLATPVYRGSTVLFPQASMATDRWNQHEVGYTYGLVGSSRVDLQACKLEYSIVSPK